jgi:ABC-type glycerol-3-phosphate transport system permease component
MMQSFFNGIPTEMEEAGTIDGCGRLRCLFSLVIPVSGPGLAAVSIFAFNYCWNEYLLGSLLLKTEGIRTLPVGLQSFMQEHTTDWGSLMAASTLAIVPVLVFLIFMQKYIVTGMTAGSIKG